MKEKPKVKTRIRDYIKKRDILLAVLYLILVYLIQRSAGFWVGLLAFIVFYESIADSIVSRVEKVKDEMLLEMIEKVSEDRLYWQR